MKILLTGASGFVGWHTRARLQALTDHHVVTIGRAEWADLDQRATGVDAIVHIAGVNRGPNDDVAGGNKALAQDVAAAARASGSSPRIIFANSIKSGEQSAYGSGKQAATEILATTARELGSSYVDVRLPNLFGEHCRPSHNSFVATFIQAVIDGREPAVRDQQIRLAHVQTAAQSLVDALTTPQTRLEPEAHLTSIRQVLSTLELLWNIYSTGDIPFLIDNFQENLFNSLRAALFPSLYPLRLPINNDARGRLVETVKSHGGQGQTFFSTTKPGMTRGQHFHLRKFERFVVISGRGRISLRRLFTSEVVSFDVSGDEPSIVDMPTLWVHEITNTGTTDLITMFWTSTLFDPTASDTYMEQVQGSAVTDRT